MRTSPSIRRRRTSRPFTASSTRSRRLRAGSRSSTACCAPNDVRSISPDRRRNCCRGRSRRRCAGERCRGRSSRSRSGSTSDYRGIDGAGDLSTKRRLTIVKAFDEYWERGGFPEVAGLGRDLRIRIHQEYFSTILFRDLVERHDVSHPRAVSDLAHRLVDNAASLYTVNSLTGYLKSLGHKVPKAAVSEYLGVVRRRLFPVHRAHLRRIGGAQERQPEDGVLHRSRPDHFGGIGDSGQLRPPAGEPGVHGAAAQVSGDPLLPDANWAQGRLLGPAPRPAADAGAGMRVPGRSADAEAGDRRAGRGDGGTGRRHRDHRHPQRAGADRGSRARLSRWCRPGGSCSTPIPPAIERFSAAGAA